MENTLVFSISDQCLLDCHPLSVFEPKLAVVEKCAQFFPHFKWVPRFSQLLVTLLICLLIAVLFSLHLRKTNLQPQTHNEGRRRVHLEVFIASVPEDC